MIMALTPEQLAAMPPDDRAKFAELVRAIPMCRQIVLCRLLDIMSLASTIHRTVMLCLFALKPPMYTYCTSHIKAANKRVD